MGEYGFLLTHIFLYTERVVNSVLINKSTGQWKPVSQRAFTSSKLTIESLEQGMKYIQS